MSIDKNTGAEISLEEAKGYIAAFGKRYPEEVKAFFIGSNQVAKILEQENCIGIRIYNGYDAVEKRMNQVMVGVDTDEKDMTRGVILDRMVPCPSFCDSASALMS
jgi:hypothetical protein